ncbi:MAG: leucine-rich repeat domain-containing protein [Chloroflexota bacterium]
MKLLVAFLVVTLSLISLEAQDEATGYEIALERIMEADETNAKELNLVGLGLTELPIEIGRLSNLERLYIGTNNLTQLPTEIINLMHLMILNLNWNDFSEFPLVITELSNLTRLQIGYNSIRQLPVEIKNLENLEELSLTSNNLESLPSSLSRLNNLCILDVGGNQLNSLPSELTQLTELEEQYCGLYTDGNPLSPIISDLMAEGGTTAVLQYLESRARWNLRRSVIAVVSLVGIVVILLLGLRKQIIRNHEHKVK